MKKTRKNDVILIAGIFALGAVLALIVFLCSKPGAQVQIRVDGEVVMNLPLDKNDTIDISGFSDGHNVLVIENGEAYMTEASCPDKLCVNMGKIRISGQSIVCLPNKVVVEIVADRQENTKVDAVVK